MEGEQRERKEKRESFRFSFFFTQHQQPLQKKNENKKKLHTQLDSPLPGLPFGPHRLRLRSIPARQAVLRRPGRSGRPRPGRCLRRGLRLGRVRRRDVRQRGRREAAGAARVQGRRALEGHPGERAVEGVPGGSLVGGVFFEKRTLFSFSFFPEVEVRRVPGGGETKKKLIFFFLSLSPFLQKKHKRTYDSFYPKDGNPLVPDLSKNVGSMPLGLTVAEDIFSAGGGLAPKFVGSPVPLPPPPSASSAATPALSPAEVIEGGLSGVTRAPRSRGVDYEPEPGLGEVSDMFVRPRRK